MATESRQFELLLFGRNKLIFYGYDMILLMILYVKVNLLILYALMFYE